MTDTIKILVATDNHVGYNERDPVRGDDSWKSFHEIMCLAKERDVDMVLLGGDLFHDNVPSRKSMYNVMRSLRLNCYGDKPCEVQLLSDGTEHFDTSIGHANYEDTNINVAIPVFSIHGNHDDPSGDGHFAALDILEMSGLINYFGRVPRGDDIDVKPLLLQKGSTKLALYGLSNVRDERLYRTFKEKKVTFFDPGIQRDDWFQMAVVHQNHHARTATSYLPENFLPSSLDLVIWGHEHECDIEPHLNPEMNFRVMQPGSSVATSLIAGEAIPKQVTILTITGREFRSAPIRLRTVRPFVYKDIVLSQEKEAIKIAQKDNHRHKLSSWLQNLVEELISDAQQQWQEAQNEDNPESSQQDCPLPLVRLRVETSPVNGGTKFEVENPQRFSNRFKGRIANSHDVVQFHVKKKAAAARRAAASEELKELMARPETAENVKVSQLVQDFLAAQSLTILPQNYFGDAVNQYIDKDDKHAMDMFVNEALSKQIRHLVTMHEAEEPDEEEDDLAAQIESFRSQMEDMFKNGELKNRGGGKARYKPKPEGWDTDMDGEWEDQAAAVITADKDSDDEMFNDDDAGTPEPQKTTRSRGRGRARATRGTTTTSTRGRGGATTAKKNTTSTSKPTTTNTRGTKSRKKAIEQSSDEDQAEAEDVIMLDDNEDEDVEEDNSQAMFFPDKKSLSINNTARTSRAGSATSNTRAPTTSRTTTNGKAPPSAPPTRKTPARTATAARSAKQSTINFSTSQASVFGNGTSQNVVSDIEDEDDDEDAFEPASSARGARRR